MRYRTPRIWRVLSLSWLLPLLGGCASGGAQHSAKLSQTHYFLGADYVKKKQPVLAKTELFKAVELNPENQEAHQLLGVLFFMEGMNKMNLLDRVQCLDGVAATEEIAVANEDFRRSEDHLLKAVRLAAQNQQTDSESLNYLANISLHFKRYDEAIRRAQQALSSIIYAARHLALGTLGWAYYQKGDTVGAARELRQATFHEPAFCIGHYRLAKVYYDQKEHEKAIEELKKVTEDKACPIQEAYQLLGLIYLKQRQPDQARVQFDSCVKLNPRSCLSRECERYAKLI